MNSQISPRFRDRSCPQVVAPTDQRACRIQRIDTRRMVPDLFVKQRTNAGHIFRSALVDQRGVAFRLSGVAQRAARMAERNWPGVERSGGPGIR